MGKVTKTDNEWKKELTPEQYYVLRQKGTEAPYSGKLTFRFDKGMYVCAACGAELFNSDTKFESHSGWPSFYNAVPGAVEFRHDASAGMDRTEVICAACGSHLGHMFVGEGYDTPTDKHYCVNSTALDFKKK